MKKLMRWFLGVLFGVVACAHTAQASLIEGSFEGLVAFAFSGNPQGIIGQPVVGHFQYDSSAPILSRTPTSATYIDSATGSLSLRIGALTWTADSVTIGVQDNHFAIQAQNFSSSPGAPGASLAGFSLHTSYPSTQPLPTSRDQLNLGYAPGDGVLFTSAYSLLFIPSGQSFRLGPSASALHPFSNVATSITGPAYTLSGHASPTPEVSFDGSQFVVKVALGLTGFSPSQSLIDTFVSGIESAWSNRYFIRDGTDSRPLIFDVSMAYNDPNADFQIELRNTFGDFGGRWQGLRPDWDTWYTDIGVVDVPGVQLPLGLWTPAVVQKNFDYALGDFAAHEFGHILGLVDEYKDGDDKKCNNTAEPIGTMGCWMTLADGSIDIGPVQARYFDGLLTDISDIVGHPVAGFAPDVAFISTRETFGTGESDVPTVPEPTSLALLVIGLAALGAIRRRKQV